MGSVNSARRRRLALVCCLGAGFGTLFDSAIVTYTVPYLTSELGAETNAIQWFLSAYSLTFGLGLVPGGRLGDVYGRRGLFVGGLLIFLTGALAAGLSPTIWLIVAARVVQGFGAGLISAQVLGIIQDQFGGTARVKALALYTMAGAAAAIVGPLAAGAALTWLPTDVGWRVVLLLSIPIILATALLAFVALAKPAEWVRRRAQLDLPGIATLGLIVVLVTLPVIDPGVTGILLWTVLGVVALLIAGLVLWERHYASRGRVPLFVPELMRSRGFIGGNLVALLWFGSVLAQGSIVTIFLLQNRQPLLVALLLAPAALARILSSGWSSRLYSRFGTAVISVGLGAQAVSTVALVLGTTVLNGAALLVLILVIECWIGVMSGFVEPPLRAVTLGFAADDYRGVAASFLQLTQRLSATFCVALATGLVFGSLSDAATGLASVDGLRNGLMLCAVLGIGAAVVAGAVLSPAAKHHREQITVQTEPAVEPVG
jgi:MFS family permease